MALTQAQRIELSKKVIEIPEQNQALAGIKNNIENEKVKQENIDNSNKSFMDEVTVHINAYQNEIKLLDGNDRTELLEQDMVDAANKIKQNFFFPNDVQVPLPNVPDGVWKFLVPFSGSKAIGLDYTEAFPSTITKEQDKIDAINAIIATVESIQDSTRSTGLVCSEDTSGTCSGETPPGSGIDEPTCLTNGGTWTPSGGPDTYSPDPTIQTALTDLVTALDDWKLFIQNEQSQIYTSDPDAGRQAENNAAIADINNTISVIDNYLLYDDFDTTTVLPSGSNGTACAIFDALTAADFVPSKLRADELQEIKDEITARQAFISTRISQITTNLGSVGQNLATGVIDNSGSGYYDERFKIINVRLNLLGGSLTVLKGTEKGAQAQDDLTASNDNAIALYDTKIKATKFKAPASNTGTIHVIDASGFSPGDSIYVVADKQQELSGSIVSISGNTIVVDFNIPEKYTHINFSRIYKLL